MRTPDGVTVLAGNPSFSLRLIEAGVRCVTIDHTNWDTHYNNFDVLKNDLLPHLDTGLPMLLRDLEDRGMLDTTLVCVMGEFGRTPRVNKYEAVFSRKSSIRAISSRIAMDEAAKGAWGPIQAIWLFTSESAMNLRSVSRGRGSQP